MKMFLPFLKEGKWDQISINPYLVPFNWKSLLDKHKKRRLEKGFYDIPI